MPYFQQEVIETRSYNVLYTVEAKDAKEAASKIAAGDTFKEEELKNNGVSQRDTWGDIVKIKKSDIALFNIKSFVIVTPIKGDTFNEFTGRIVSIRKDTDGKVLYSVEDQDEDVFEVYNTQLKFRSF